MPGVVFVALCAVMWAAAMAFPAYQLAKGGHLYFENHLDESSYLQYDFARANHGPTRLGEYLVTGLHELGVSGGYINALMDGVAIAAFLLLGRAVFRRLGWASAQANAGAVALLALPQLVLTTNGLVGALSDAVIHHGLLAWVTMPFLPHSPLFRSPEPQCSWVLLAAAAWLALRLRAFWPAYAVLPFLYPFLGIPAAFVTLATHLHARWPERVARWKTPGALALAFLAVGLACRAYYQFLLPGPLRLLFVASAAPLLSVTSTLALAAWALGRRWIAPEHRFFALAVAAAGMAAANQQLLSGLVPQPSSFELYAGCVAFALVVALMAAMPRRALTPVLALGVALFVGGAYHTYRVNQSFMLRLPLEPRLLAALKEDPTRVVVNDTTLVSTLNMLYPRQAPTALAYENTFVLVGDRHVDRYRQVRCQIRKDYHDAFDRQLASVDNAFVYGSQNYLMGAIQRRTEFEKLHDMSTDCARVPELRLRYFFINWVPAPPRFTPDMP